MDAGVAAYLCRQPQALHKLDCLALRRARALVLSREDVDRCAATPRIPTSIQVLQLYRRIHTEFILIGDMYVTHKKIILTPWIGAAVLYGGASHRQAATPTTTTCRPGKRSNTRARTDGT